MKMSQRIKESVQVVEARRSNIYKYQVCNNCGYEHLLNTIFDKIHNCPKCKNKNLYDKTKIVY